MDDSTFVSHEASVRLMVFTIILALLILWERWAVTRATRASPALPWLWRIHRVHHADSDVDVSTALRFHPIESVLSMLLKHRIHHSTHIAQANRKFWLLCSVVGSSVWQLPCAGRNVLRQFDRSPRCAGLPRARALAPAATDAVQEMSRSAGYLPLGCDPELRCGPG
jgi:hypothetical protein